MQRKYIVPAGFITDFASIPRLFWTVVGHPAGKYAQAAVLHDYLYRTNSVSRAKADSLFRRSNDCFGSSILSTLGSLGRCASWWIYCVQSY